MKLKLTNKALILGLALSVLAGCSNVEQQTEPIPNNQDIVIQNEVNEDKNNENTVSEASFDVNSIPEYNGQAWIYVNDNKPFFTEEEITDKSFESYSDLDELGRAGTAMGSLSSDTQPEDGTSRGNISFVKPTGWKYNGKNNNNSYDCVEGGYIYNRCHLIMWALSAEDANERNLITGTRYLNVDGMLPWETKADEYVDRTGNHIMYRVTPIYTGDNLLADGVLMECYSVEDNGQGLEFCVYCYNVQPGISINYANGTNEYNEDFLDTTGKSVISEAPSQSIENTQKENYIINTNTGKFHKEDCSFGKKTSEKNKEIRNSTYDELISEGYTPCGVCLK